MATWEKKIIPEFFEEILAGKKKYEFRLGDFQPKEGDMLVLKEWDPAVQKFTGREVKKTITQTSTFYIDKTFWPKEEILEKGITVCSLE